MDSFVLQIWIRSAACRQLTWQIKCEVKAAQGDTIRRAQQLIQLPNFARVSCLESDANAGANTDASADSDANFSAH